MSRRRRPASQASVGFAPDQLFTRLLLLPHRMGRLIVRVHDKNCANYSLLRIFGSGSATKVVLHIAKRIHDRRIGGTARSFAANNATCVDTPRLLNHRKVNSPNDIGFEPHEHIPFLLVSDGAVSLGNFVGVHQFLKARQGFVIRVDGFAEGQIPRGVLMTRINEGRIGECAQIGQRCVHLRAIPFEEATTATGKEGVPSEDNRGGARKGLICHIVADGILGMTRGRKAPSSAVSKSLRQLE